MRTILAAVVLLLSSVAFADIDITVQDNPVAWPVTCGVALPEGFATSADEFTLVDSNGNAVPFTAEVVSRWRTDGPAKWIHLRWIAQANAHKYRLVKQAPKKFDRLPVDQTGDTYTVETAGLKLSLSKGSLAVEHQGKTVVRQMSNIIAKTTAPKKPIPATFDSINIERHTPTEVTFLLTGKYDESAHILLRVSMHRDIPLVFFDHTFRFMGDLNKDVYTDIATSFELPKQSSRAVTFDLGKKGQKQFKLSSSIDSLSMVQENVIHINNATPVKPKRAAPALFDGETLEEDGGKPSPDYYAVIASKGKTDDVLTEGQRCGDSVMFDVADVPMTASLRFFWQSFPKEWEVSADRLTLHLFSPRGGDLGYSPAWREKWIGKESLEYNKKYEKYDLLRAGDPRGADKRHEFFLAFGEQAAAYEPMTETPAVAHADPVWLCNAKPFIQPIIPANLNHPNEHIRVMEQTIDATFDLMLEAVDRTGGYGFFEQGFGHHYFYEWNEEADRLFIGFYRFMNHDYFVRRNLWMNYYRSGNRKYLDYLTARMQHFLDVEVAHGNVRDNIPDGSWSKDMWYWENWQNAFERTYQVSARGIAYYLAYSGDPRARWQLEQWRDWFMKKENIDQWAQEHLMWSGQATFSSWRVPCTTIGNLVTLYEVFGDQKLLDMAAAVMRAFEDKNSPSGTKHIWSASKYEYTMWEKGEYYRVPRFNEVVRLRSDSDLKAMRDKLLEYWMLQRADYYSSYDQVPITLYHMNRDPVAASMLKMYIEDPDRAAMLDRVRTPIGPDGPQGVLHPSNNIRLIWFSYPCLIAVYQDMLEHGTDDLLNRFENAGVQKVWVGQKRTGKPFVMQLIAPGRDAQMQFYDQKNQPIDSQYIKRVAFHQDVEIGNHIIFTVTLPAEHTAQQVWGVGTGAFIIAGSEKAYLFDPGDVWTAFDDSSALIWYRGSQNNFSIDVPRDGDDSLLYFDSQKRETAPTKDGVTHRFQTVDRVIGIQPHRIHWRSQAAIDFRNTPAQNRFFALGNPSAMFDPSPMMVKQHAIDSVEIAKPSVSETWVPGVNGKAMHINENSSLVVRTTNGQPVQQADEGTLEFWFKPLWDTRLQGGNIIADNLLFFGIRKADEINASIQSGGKRGTYFVAYPESPSIPMKANQWYHVAIGWKTMTKREKPFDKGTPVVWVAVDGNRVTYRPKPAGNGKSRSGKPLMFSTTAERPYLIDEIRISSKNRYHESSESFGGFDMKTVSPPRVEDDTLLLLHLDGDVSAEGANTKTHQPEHVRESVPLWP